MEDMSSETIVQPFLTNYLSADTSNYQIGGATQVYINTTLERWTVLWRRIKARGSDERWTGCSGPNAFLIKCTANPEPDSTDMWNTQHCVFFKGQPLSFPSSLLRTAMSAMSKWLQQNNRFLEVEKTKQARRQSNKGIRLHNKAE